MAATIDTLTAGQQVRCTIEKVPAAEGKQDTIQRLMRRDPEIKRGLKRAQQLRARRMNVYIRGNRRWHSREKAARIARCVEGRTWTMPFTHDIAPDLASVEQFLKIESA